MELKDIQKPKLYRMSEVSKFMEVTYGTLYRMVKQGKLKAYNIAKSGKKPIFAFLAEDIQSYYDSISSSINLDNQKRSIEEDKTINQ